MRRESGCARVYLPRQLGASRKGRDISCKLKRNKMMDAFKLRLEKCLTLVFFPFSLAESRLSRRVSDKLVRYHVRCLILDKDDKALGQATTT